LDGRVSISAYPRSIAALGIIIGFDFSKKYRGKEVLQIKFPSKRRLEIQPDSKYDRSSAVQKKSAACLPYCSVICPAGSIHTKQ